MIKNSNNFVVSILLTLVISLFLGLIFLKNSILFFGFFIISLLVLFAARFPLLFLIFYFVLNEKLFQTINLGLPNWFYRDACLIILFIVLIIQFLRGSFQNNGPIITKYFKYIILILVVINVSTFVGGYFVFKQPISSLIFQTRDFYFYFLFLYLISVSFNFKQIKIFMKFLLWSTICVSLLLIIDAYIFGGGKIFELAMSNGISGMRAGQVRIAVYWFIASWVYFYLLSTINYSKNIKSKFFAFLALAFIVIQLLFVGMGRQLLLGLFLTTFIFCFNKLKRFRTILVCLIVFLSLVLFFFALNKTDLFKQSIVYRLVDQTLFESEQTTSGSIAVRLNGIKYFYPDFLKSKFLGMGILSSTEENSPVAIGLRYYGYNFNDFGLFAIVFRFGFFSLILLFLLLRSCFRDLRLASINENVDVKILADSIMYLLISKIILFPTITIFFKESDCLYYVLILYFVYILNRQSTPNKLVCGK